MKFWLYRIVCNSLNLTRNIRKIFLFSFVYGNLQKNHLWLTSAIQNSSKGIAETLKKNIKGTIVRILSLVMAFMLCGSICAVQAAEAITNNKMAYEFELPVEGTTGYGVIDLNMRSGDSMSAAKIMTVKAGQPFTIRQEGDTYFRVQLESGEEGWIY